MDRDLRYWQSPGELDGGAPVAGGELAGGRRLWDLPGEGPPGSRRDFLKAMGFGLAAASVAACAPIPERRAVPMVEEPEGVLPGVASWYATTCGGCPAGCGLLVKTRDGRPVKIEGDPESALSRGGTCAVGQATVLSLYDGERLSGPRWLGRPASWEEVDAAVAARLEALGRRGAAVVLLTGTLHSPSARDLVERWRRRSPSFRHVVHDPAPAAALRLAAGRGFRPPGRPVLPRYRFDRARVIVGLDADFLGTWLSPVEFARDYARGRRPRPRGEGGVTCHVQIEPGLSLTGSNADLRIPVEPSELGVAALALLAGVARRAGEPPPPAWARWSGLATPASSPLPQAGPGAPAAPGPDGPAALDELPPAASDRRGIGPGGVPGAPGLPAGLDSHLDRLDEVAAALWEHRGRSLVVSGVEDAAVQRVVARINVLLGNVGTTVDLDHPSLQRQGDPAAVHSLIAEMERGEVGALLVWGANPGYDHPQAARFLAAMERVALTVSFADRLDETARGADAVCPDHHFLESWGDAEPVAGHLRLLQPTIAPLFATRAAPESLLAWTGAGGTWHDYVRRWWRAEVFPRSGRTDGFDAFWDEALERGGFDLPAATAPAPVPPGGDLTDPGDLAEAAEAILDAHRRGRAARLAGNIEVHLHETVALRDGRWANNPWLQELPDPVTRLTWGCVAALSPALAARLGVEDGDVVALRRKPGAAPVLELPALVQPGQAPGTVSLALGYGRAGAGRVGDGVGVNAYPLSAPGTGGPAGGPPGGLHAGFHIERTGRRAVLALVQLHGSAEGRPLVRETTPAALARMGAAPAGLAVSSAVAGSPPVQGSHGAPGEEPSLYPEPARPGPVWGMAIDLSACTGCSACVVACQAENNVPVVGREEVARGREMHWLRIDRYYRGPAAAPATVHQPMLCQHCDNAPCETVCPVLATVHSSDGLNQQVYNRCVGTRYCANNCPYKVRRFNWFDYAENDRFPFHMNDALGRMVLNPEVVVRSRGVMEKCSMCVQRIEEGRLAARRAGRPVRDGDVRTACQQACPAEAIAFGDAADPDSEVSRRRRDARFFRVLEELNTRPGVGYLAKVRHEA